MKKRIIIICAIVLTLLLIGGIIIKNTKKPNKYKQLEKDLINISEKYFLETEEYFKDYAIVTTDKLKTYSSDLNLVVDGDHCTGYVEMKNSNNQLNYKSYIKCEKYETKEYDIAKNPQNYTCTEDC